MWGWRVREVKGLSELAENYQEYGLYDSDGNYKGMFYSIEEINDFLEETMTADARYIK